MTDTYSLLAGCLALLFASWMTMKRTTSKCQLPLPPGPRPKPLVGNIADLPPPGGHDWEHWFKHKDLYGPISSVTIFGQVMILIHDLSMALELLEKRGANYSSRAKLVFAGELCGYNERMPFQTYNATFRQQRKLAGGQLGSRQAVSRFYPAMDVEARRFLLRTLEDPSKVFDHLESEAGSMMLDMLYGYKPTPHSPDLLVRLINTVMEEFGEAVKIGAWIVDLVPWLRHLPDFLPGMGFKKTARLWREHSDQSMNVPIDFVKEQMANNNARPSFSERLLREHRDTPMERHVRETAAALYAGGADTTASGLGFFYLAMTIHPEVQKRAQEELGRIVGSERLPRMEDRENLPYIEAIVKEVLRWRPLAPLAPPRVAEEDDVFLGYRIPKGTLVMPNIKAFSLDPKLYEDAELFKPERFLGTTQPPDPADYVFGFGRRICPGRLLADSTIFLTIAQSLAVFNISSPIDPGTGKPVLPPLGITKGLVAHPLPFKCDIVARSEKHEAMIRSIAVEHPWEEGDAKLLKGIS